MLSRLGDKQCERKRSARLYVNERKKRAHYPCFGPTRLCSTTGVASKREYRLPVRLFFLHQPSMYCIMWNAMGSQGAERGGMRVHEERVGHRRNRSSGLCSAGGP